ncbi:LLM class flavin-dependent oxidoreductase [Celeribacter indicus]|uniref:FMN-dependent oxidoreductase, nitrilotriacetate monooxygenase n=1 Tax=Celeribacter indicus TaxID=1208324 RepID=A0A0B5E5X8_9RHOB|nr:LLM class flavin-dependent oxidoreductase [Celeribacter indicus]AJE48800.1 FMN-dependent oxidoreductase, nitrilotriacetate monooxygenase [Celeribacter indicus]
MTKRNQMHLMLQTGIVGNHHGAWRRPRSRVEDAHGLAFHAWIARLAENAKLDAVFVADGLSTMGGHRYAPRSFLEPFTLLAALAGQTSKVGLVATASTSFSEPYNLARQFASLDHLSNGRAAWNIVTSFLGEENFGSEPLPPAEQRYARAAEYLDVSMALWDSWKPGSLVIDRDSGIYARDDLVREINHEGEFFSVKGPLNVARSPQGRPVLVQAGSSELGKNLAAQYAEVVFTAQQSLEGAKAFYRDIKARVAAHGRNPDTVKVLVGATPLIAPTKEEAGDLRRELAALIHEDFGRERISKRLGGADLSQVGLDEQIPPSLLPGGETVERIKSRFDVYRRLAVDEKRTLRELIEVEATSSGHWVFEGSPQSIAEELITIFDAGAADGFILLPTYAPEGIELLTGGVVPLLQERGYFRTEYQGDTLRSHLGLDDFPDQFLHAQQHRSGANA